MKKYVNGVYEEMTAEEVAKHETAIAQLEREYWQNVPYDEAVNTEIRKRYSVSQELAILRQQDKKPEEYAEYYAFCEECKEFVKRIKEENNHG